MVVIPRIPEQPQQPPDSIVTVHRMVNILKMVIFQLLMVTIVRWYRSSHTIARMGMVIVAMVTPDLVMVIEMVPRGQVQLHHEIVLEGLCIVIYAFSQALKSLPDHGGNRTRDLEVCRFDSHYGQANRCECIPRVTRLVRGGAKYPGHRVLRGARKSR